MNIHCSACGAPLLTVATSCQSCALPLTSIAMPTPALRRKRVSTVAIIASALALLWILAYALDAHDSAKAAKAQQSPSTPSIGIDQTLEQRMENADWFSATRLREWRSDVLQDEQSLRSSDSPAAQSALRDDQAALARIDDRLKQLHAQ
jgi:hypothetical protein